MPGCCWCKCRLSTFHWCCCACSVPLSSEKLPLLDKNESISLNAGVKELHVSESYTKSKNKSITQSKIRIVTTSDMHMHHTEQKMPDGDILIIAGDFTNWRTTKTNTNIVLEWLASLNQYKHKIIIAGNHEIGINEENPSETVQLFKDKANAIYLQDTFVEVCGLKIYGTPWHPKRGCLYHAEAFGKKTNELKKIFDAIPTDTDILITHVPPYGVRDFENAGHIGSDSLLFNSRDRVRPIMHIFGHVHQQNGYCYLKGFDTFFVNTATKVNVFDIIFSDTRIELQTKQDDAIGEEEEENLLK